MSERFEREIDEILRKLDGQPTSPPRPIPRPSPYRGFQRKLYHGLWSLYSLRWRWGTEQVMLAGYALALVSLVLPRVPFLILPLGWAMVGLLSVGYVLGYRRSGWQRERRWRGRSIDYGRPGWAGLWQSFLKYWRRRR